MNGTMVKLGVAVNLVGAVALGSFLLAQGDDDTLVGELETSAGVTVVVVTTSEVSQTSSSVTTESAKESVPEKRDVSNEPSKPKPKPTVTPEPSNSSPSTYPPPRPVDPGFPTVNPLHLENATDSYYIASNDTQASLYGLNPGDVRTWGMEFAPSDSAAADHASILAGLLEAGFTVINDEMRANPDGTVGSFRGKYQTWTFSFTMINRKHISLSLLNW